MYKSDLLFCYKCLGKLNELDYLDLGEPEYMRELEDIKTTYTMSPITNTTEPDININKVSNKSEYDRIKGKLVAFKKK